MKQVLLGCVCGVAKQETQFATNIMLKYTFIIPINRPRPDPTQKSSSALLELERH